LSEASRKCLFWIKLLLVYRYMFWIIFLSKTTRVLAQQWSQAPPQKWLLVYSNSVVLQGNFRLGVAYAPHVPIKELHNDLWEGSRLERML
jgi:hypothetical protein